MAVVMLDLVGKDASAIKADIEKIVEDAGSQGATITAMSLVLDGSCLVCISTPVRIGSAAGELEGFKRLLDSSAINVFDFDKAKERLISAL